MGTYPRHVLHFELCKAFGAFPLKYSQQFYRKIFRCGIVSVFRDDIIVIHIPKTQAQPTLMNSENHETENYASGVHLVLVPFFGIRSKSIYKKTIL